MNKNRTRSCNTGKMVRQTLYIPKLKLRKYNLDRIAERVAEIYGTDGHELGMSLRELARRFRTHCAYVP